MADKVTLAITIVDEKRVVTGVIGIKQAADLLCCSRNTVKAKVKEGKVNYFWVDYGEPGGHMLFYKRDVLALQKAEIKKQECKLKKLRKGNSK